MDRGRNRPTPARFRQLSVLCLSIVALMFAAWMWMADSPAPRLKNVGDEMPGSNPSYVFEIGLAALAVVALLGAVITLRSKVGRQSREAALIEELRESREHAQRGWG